MKPAGLSKARLPFALESPDSDQLLEPLVFEFAIRRRAFVQILGTGLLIFCGSGSIWAQRGGEGGSRRRQPSASAGRIQIGKDGKITVMTGKVEVGQGSRAELTQAAAEELKVSADKIQLVMADTALVPDDGMTAGSRSTPSSVPAVRQAAAAARMLLSEVASRRWNVDASTLEFANGTITHSATNQSLGYADLAQSEDLAALFQQPSTTEPKLTPPNEWKVLGTSIPAPGKHDIITGAHRYPSDIERPGMGRGKILRPPTYGAVLTTIDLGPARAMENVVAVQDGPFVGVIAPTTHLAQQALDAIAATAKWDSAPHPPSSQLYDYLRERAKGDPPKNPFADELTSAAKHLKQTYHVAYAQHAPMETRTAVAEWTDGRLTVWTGTQNPFGYQNELARTFHLSNEQVRVIVPDTGGGFGGKHTAEVAIEAARLAQAANRPVSLRWTREEEFTWAYFRPAAVIDIEATLDAQGTLTSWHFININSGRAAIDTPYRIPKAKSQSIDSQAPLRQGSYRGLAATANTFARECFMDELAAAAGKDPLEFRLAHLENPRLRAVLDEAAKRFRWKERVQAKKSNTGIGISCGTEKGSFVAACVEIELKGDDDYVVRHVCEVFECGAIVNPNNLLAQVQGAILMGLGPALREEMQFEGGKMLNPSFSKYHVPRFSDVPELDIHLLNGPDLPSVGAGETPIIAVANAVANATGARIHAMPIRRTALR